MADDHLRLLVAPEMSFDAMQSQLNLHGYALRDQSADPLISREPEWAVFANGSDCRIHYSFNPVATFRALEFHGDGAVAGLMALAGALPTVDWMRARSFLRSANPRDQWLGILAAEQLGDVRLRPMVEALAGDGESRIAAGARQALISIPDTSAATEMHDAWKALLAEQERRPDLNVLFRHMPGVELKRQVLRWTGREGKHGGARVERLLRTALTDDDPEVRVTAMLVAARLEQRAVVEPVRDAHVPTTRADGAPPGDRLYYGKLQRLVVRCLRAPQAAGIDEAGANRFAEFEAALRGEQPVDRDETMLWHALVTPLDLGHSPTQLPAGVVDTADGYELSVLDGSVDLCWVGAVPHWLGGLNGERPDDPVRQRTPAPFFISVAPLTTTPGQHGNRWTGSLGAARELLARIADETALPLRPPTADEWEMAARGPDGRFYPWGVGLEKGWQSACSPWGMAGFGIGAEWATDKPGAGAVLVNGVNGTEPWPAARRRRPSFAAGVRLVLPG